jgi:hypothetical protein
VKGGRYGEWESDAGHLILALSRALPSSLATVSSCPHSTFAHEEYKHSKYITPTTKDAHPRLPGVSYCHSTAVPLLRQTDQINHKGS